MGDEYSERKIRVYEPKVVKGESKVSKYFVKPMKKFVLKEGSNSSTRRLTA